MNLKENIFVISLKTRKDRRDLIKNNIHTASINFNIVDAVNGYEIDYDWILEKGFFIDEDWREPYCNYPVQKGEVGCFLSHYFLWEKCVEKDEPIIIFEDDFLITREIPFDEISELINEYDFIYLDWMEQYKTIKINDYLCIPGLPFCTHAYVITPTAAKELIKSKRIIPSDECIPRHLKKFRVCGYNEEYRFVSYVPTETDIPRPINGKNGNEFLKKEFSMNNKILEKGYIILRNFIEKDIACEIGNIFKLTIARNRVDWKDPDLFTTHNPISGIELLVNKNKEVSDILGEKLLPKCCYLREDVNQSKLEKHTDHYGNEISLMVHLWSDKPWDFHMESLEGTTELVNLECGDAIVYLGSKISYWREPYQGESYIQLFLEYVRQNGENKHDYFQIGEVKQSSYYSNMIYHLGEYFNPSECDYILNEYNQSDEWYRHEYGDCDFIEISHEDSIIKNKNVRKGIDDFIFKKISNLYSKYAELFPNMIFSSKDDIGYTLLKYDWEFYRDHPEYTDDFKNKSKTLTMIINLNDEYVGGELSFWGKKKVYNLQKGDAIVFPSNFMYPHKVLPVKFGTRYSIITWMI